MDTQMTKEPRLPFSQNTLTIKDSQFVLSVEEDNIIRIKDAQFEKSELGSF